MLSNLLSYNVTSLALTNGNVTTFEAGVGCKSKNYLMALNENAIHAVSTTA